MELIELDIKTYDEYVKNHKQKSGQRKKQKTLHNAHTSVKYSYLNVCTSL